MEAPTPVALKKREAINVDRRDRSRNMALRKRIRRMGARQCRWSPSIRHEPRAWLTTTMMAAARHRRPTPWVEALVHGCTHDRLWAEPLVRGHPSVRVWGCRWRTVDVPGPGSTAAAVPPLLIDDYRTQGRALPFTWRCRRRRGHHLDGLASGLQVQPLGSRGCAVDRSR